MTDLTFEQVRARAAERNWRLEQRFRPERSPVAGKEFHLGGRVIGRVPDDLDDDNASAFYYVLSPIGGGWTGERACLTLDDVVEFLRVTPVKFPRLSGDA
jgi:hypothetical protein